MPDGRSFGAFPLMGAAYAAADTGPTVGGSENSAPADSAACICETKCSSASKNAFCPVCLAGDDGYLNCAGKALEPEPAPACTCDVKCTETTKNPDCPICAADISGCTGKEPEPAPACTCDVKCTETTKNPDCPVCAADVSGCTGKEPEPAPTCTCTVKCEAGRGQWGLPCLQKRPDRLYRKIPGPCSGIGRDDHH